MNEWKLRDALLEKNDPLREKNDPLSDKAIRTRLSRARRVERILREGLDVVVANDDRVYAALLTLKSCPEERNGGLQNALRWYYRAVNRRDFPKLSEYCPKEQFSYEVSTKADVGLHEQSHSEGAAASASTNESSEPIGSLWREFCSVKNRISSALGRSNNVVGELAERIVAEYHGTVPLAVSHPSADVELKDGTLIQVKARMLTDVRTTPLSAFRSWNFDVLSVVLFEPDGDIAFGGEIPCSIARRYAREVSHVNGWQISTTHDFLSDPAFTDLTDAYRRTLENL